MNKREKAAYSNLLAQLNEKDAQLTALREQQRWRDVEKELPSEMEFYVVWIGPAEDEAPHRDVAFYNASYKVWGVPVLDECADGPITHWKPFPQLSEGDKP